MASFSVPNTNSMPDPSRTSQNIKVSKSQLLSTCFYKRSKYYFPTLDPKAHEFSQEVLRLFSGCYRTQTPNLGVLAHLPRDLLEEIVLHLDIDSFRQFRQVSRRARYLSTAISTYYRVLRYAPDALNALRRTDLSISVSYKDVYNAPMTSKCAFCGSFGDFLFLPTAERCCFECLRTSPETALVNEGRISRREPWKSLYTDGAEDLTYALKSTDVRSFKTHNWDNVQKMSKTCGVLAKDLLAAYIKVDKTLEEPGQSLLKPGWLHYRLAASIIFPSLNPRTGKLQTGVSCKCCHLNLWKLSPPSLVPATSQNFMFNLHFRARDRSYSEDEAALHFSQCLESQKLWQASNSGGREIDHCMFIQQGGLYYDRANFRQREQENLADE